jgi:hypothetical protein
MPGAGAKLRQHLGIAAEPAVGENRNVQPPDDCAPIACAASVNRSVRDGYPAY